MKTRLLVYVLAAAAMAACSSNKAEEKQEAAADAATVETVNYAGVLPSADGAGIAYDLTMTSDGDQGRYSLVETYEGADTAICITQGRYQLLADANAKPTGKYYRLEPNGEPADTLYFVVTSDTTIAMVSANLQPAPSGLDYTLRKK